MAAVSMTRSPGLRKHRRMRRRGGTAPLAEGRIGQVAFGLPARVPDSAGSIALFRQVVQLFGTKNEGLIAPVAPAHLSRPSRLFHRRCSLLPSRPIPSCSPGRHESHAYSWIGRWSLRWRLGWCELQSHGPAGSVIIGSLGHFPLQACLDPVGESNFRTTRPPSCPRDFSLLRCACSLQMLHQGLRHLQTLAAFDGPGLLQFSDQFAADPLHRGSIQCLEDDDAFQRARNSGVNTGRSDLLCLIWPRASFMRTAISSEVCPCWVSSAIMR